MPPHQQSASPTISLGAIDVKNWIDQQPISPRQWLILVLCFFAVLMDGFDAAVIGFVGPNLMRDWHMSPTALGPILGAAMVGLVGGALVVGPSADRFGRKRVLLCAVLCFGLFSVLSAFAHDTVQLIVLRFLTGLGLGATMPISTTLLCEYLPERSRSFLMTMMFTGFNLGSGCAGLVASRLLPRYDWPAVLLVGGLVPIVLLPLMTFFLPESARFLVLRKGTDERIRSILQTFGGRFPVGSRFSNQEVVPPGKVRVRTLFSTTFRRSTVSLWVTYFMGLLVIYLLTGWLPTLLHAQGLPTERATSITAAFQLAGTVGAVLVGRVMDWLVPSRVIAFTYACGGIVVLALGALGLGNAGLAVLVGITGFCMSGAQTGLNAYAPTLYPTWSRATGISWMLGIGRFGAIVGSLIGGPLLDGGLAPTTVISLLAIPAFCAAASILSSRQAENAGSPGQTGITTSAGPLASTTKH